MENEKMVAPRKRGRPRRGEEALPESGFVTIATRIPVELVKKLDRVAESNFRSRSHQIAYYLTEALSDPTPESKTVLPEV